MLIEKVKAACSSAQLIESPEIPTGSKWRICAMTAGKSENDVYYPEEVLRQTHKKLDGTNSYLYRLNEGASMVFDHLPVEFLTAFDAPLMGHLIGWFSKPEIETVEGRTAITADLYLHRSAQQVRDFFLDCWEHGKEIGFSITALTGYSPRVFEGVPIHWVEDIWFISCDPVSYPAVKGARLMKLLESIPRKERFKMKTEMIETLYAMGKRIAPELASQGSSREDGIAYCSRLIEALSTEDADASLRTSLTTFREALEGDKDDEAQTVLDAIIDAIKDDGVNGDAISRFGVGDSQKARAQQLLSLLGEGKHGEAKVALNTWIEEAGNDDRAWLEKLVSLSTLLEDKEWEAAQEYLAGLIEKLADEVYPKPPEVPVPPPEVVEEYPLPPTEEMPTAASEVVPVVASQESEAHKSKIHQREVQKESIMETPGVRITRIELDQILKASGLPTPAQSKIRQRFQNTEISRESLQGEVENEKGYLTSLGLSLESITEIDRAVQSAVREARATFEGEIAVFRESYEKAKTEMALLQENAKKAQTREMVKKLVRESFLPAVCARRIEELFADRVASEDEIRKAIATEASLTSEVIASIASTVKGFGETSPVTDEESAKAYVEKFFGARLSA